MRLSGGGADALTSSADALISSATMFAVANAAVPFLKGRLGRATVWQVLKSLYCREGMWDAQNVQQKEKERKRERE